MRGLRNLGSTCYINAVLQSLFHCSPFVEFLRAHQHVPLIKHLFDLCVSERIASPYEFLKALQIKFPFALGQQNDICEFTLCLIDRLNTEVKTPRSPPAPLPYRNADTYEQITKLLAHDWAMAHHKEHSPLIDLFYGQHISQIKCTHCSKIHHNYEVFMHLTLPIHGSSLSTCLERFFAPEHIEHWTCDACKTSLPSQHITRLWRLPRILIITYKRFTNALHKITTRIETPYQLNLYPYMIGPTSYTYQLKAAAFHMGHPLNGHYIAVCKDVTWTIYDDEHTEETKMNPDEAYMLFYEAA